MESESNQPAAQPGPPAPELQPAPLVEPGQRSSINEDTRPKRGDPGWVLFGSHGLRAGWSIALFAFLMYVLATIFGTVEFSIVEDGLHLHLGSGSATSTIVGESEWVGALAISFLVLSRIENRRMRDYNLATAKGLALFGGGALGGFGAVSLLVGVMAGGGWLRFGAVSLAGLPIAKYALLWGIGFCFVGLVEEGAFRCFLLSTLARSVNLWWAIGIVGGFCAFLVRYGQGNGSAGIYAVALLGLPPCVWLHAKRAEGSGFWQAAWVTSAGFGFIHTFNHGENWIGIFAAALIGFVFCVSVRLTGSAWWAIGCHAAWDWGESFFYGTADSGFVAHGHLLTSLPKGNVLWSGGADGPEGSLLVLPVVLVLLAVLAAVYGRRRPVAVHQAQAAERLAG